MPGEIDDLVLAELIGDHQFLEPEAMLVGLRLKTPLGESTLVNGLQGFAQDFPEFVNSRADKNGDLTLNNDNTDRSDHVFFSARKSGEIEFAWGRRIQRGVGWVTDMLDGIEHHFGVTLLNVSHLEFRAQVRTEVAVNHYQAILNAYFGESPLHDFFRPETVFDNDQTLKGFVDEDRVGLIRVFSRMGDHSVRKKEYSESAEMYVYAGIAQTRGIPIAGTLSRAFTVHLAVAYPFLKDKLPLKVLGPLDRALGELVAKVEP